jgi:hypothetical protein
MSLSHIRHALKDKEIFIFLISLFIVCFSCSALTTLVRNPVNSTFFTTSASLLGGPLLQFKMQDREFLFQEDQVEKGKQSAQPRNRDQHQFQKQPSPERQAQRVHPQSDDAEFGGRLNGRMTFLDYEGTQPVPLAKQPPPLRFRAGGSFTIVQFADLHFGEAPDTDWGPQQARILPGLYSPRSHIAAVMIELRQSVMHVCPDLQRTSCRLQRVH